jgi:thiamine-monophosphate kinase
VARAPALGEFELIARFFARRSTDPTVAVGIGDDCALLDVGTDQLWAVTTDLLAEGVHFLPDVDPTALGHKALAVNLSDLAACGATPRCFLLAVALPAADEQWLAQFTQGLFTLAERHRCALAGGDTTRAAAVTICITALGTVARGQALLRSTAATGDDVWVSGELGDAALALAWRRGELTLPEQAAPAAVERLERPTPRVELGERLRRVASAAIDVSDGLLGDLGHILQASGVGARIEWPAVPRSGLMRQMAPELQQRFALAGGDDYELLFTAPTTRRPAVEQAAGAAGVAVSRIGSVVPAGGLAVVDATGATMDTRLDAFDHFRPRES